MKRHLPFIFASVMCLPFFVFTLIFFSALILRPLAAAFPGIIYEALFVGLFGLSECPAVTLGVLALVSISVIAAWLQKTKTKLEIVFTSIYSVVMILHIGYAIWCLVTKPAFDL